MAHTPLQDFLLCMFCFLRSIFYLLFFSKKKKKVFHMPTWKSWIYTLKFSQMQRYRHTILDEHIVVILPLELADVQYICVKTNIHRCGWIWAGNCNGNLRSLCSIFFGYVFCNTPRLIRVLSWSKANREFLGYISVYHVLQDLQHGLAFEEMMISKPFT